MDLNSLKVASSSTLSANDSVSSEQSLNDLSQGKFDKQTTDKGTEPVESEGLVQVLQDTVEKLKQFSQIQSKNVDFSIEKFEGLSVVVVSDSQTKEVLRQIPSEEMIEVSKKIERSQLELFNSSLGVLFDQKV